VCVCVCACVCMCVIFVFLTFIVIFIAIPKNPLPNIIPNASRIEKRIWKLLTLVSEQQVTETLGEIRLRRQDIHRKLLDTSMYAAIIRFVCHQRDMSELSIVIDRVAGNANKRSGSNTADSTMFTSSKDSGNNDEDSGETKAPFVAANRRNTVIGRFKSNSGGNGTGSSNIKMKKVGLSRKDKVQVRDALRGRNDNDLRKLMRQSDQRGIAGEFQMTMNEVRSSIEKREKGGRGIVYERVGQKSSNTTKSRVTKTIIKSIKSPALKRRLLRHVKPQEYD